MAKLTDTAVRQAKAAASPYKLTDGGGLYLLLKPNGSKLWRYDYRYYGKRKTLALGIYPDVSLAKARDFHKNARETLAEGKDPGLVRRVRREARANTFKDISDAWHKAAAPSWSQAHADTIRYRLDRYLLPRLGSRPIREIEPPEMLSVLRPFMDRPDTARRAKQIASQIFRYAVAHGLADRDPTADIQGALPTQKVVSRAAIIDPRKVGALIRAVDGYEGYAVVAAALKLAPRVFVRPGELRHAEWAEIDFKAAEWRIPAEKMKMREAHVVPLSRQAIAILEGTRSITGHGRYVFPSNRTPRRPISENSLNAALRRLEYTKEEMTAHGFRAMASTLLNELGWAPDVIERQLAHAERNKVRAAYNRASYLNERRQMMQQWADYLDGLAKGADVVPIHGSK